MPVVLAAGGVASLELETLVDAAPAALPPRIRVTVTADSTVREYKLTRLCEGESWTVPGWRARSFSDAVVDVDWAAPLNRPITYSLFADGELVLTAVIQLDHGTAVLQDPVDPTVWVPVNTGDTAAGEATVSALGEVDRPAPSSLIPVMGSKYPVAVGGQVQAGSVGLGWSTYDGEAESAFRAVVQSSPVLLLRTTADMVPMPALAYLAGETSEQPVNVHYGGGYTQWRSTPTLVSAVLVASVAGLVTYDEAQQLLAGVTYDEAQAAAGSTTYLDWQKNPLIYATL